MSRKDDMVRIGVRLPADIHRELLATAQRDVRSLNNQIIYALREWLDIYGKESAPPSGQFESFIAGVSGRVVPLEDDPPSSR